MKSVLISINPKWCELIAVGAKTIEVRKTRPKIDTPFKCYIYCTNKRHYYYALSGYEQGLAQTEAGKRVCRWTKSEMVAKIGQCMGIAFAFYDLRHSYDYLKSTMDILRGDNLSILQTVKKIEEAYARATDDWLGRWNGDKEFEELLNALPDRVWIEY